MAFAEQRRRAGASWKAIATELGACFETVRRWCGGGTLGAAAGAHAERVARQLRRVEVVAEPIVNVRARIPIAVVTPNGLRIEGVGVDEVVALVRALG